MVLGALVIVTIGILAVNYFKGQKGETIPALTTQNETQKTHKVVKGDTLWAIAEANYGSGYNWVDIKEANNLKSDIIEVGQELVLPQVAAKQPTSSAKVVATENNTQTITGSTYTVVRDDSLWKIAVRAYGDGYRWVEIARENKLANPNLIHAGNVLSLPR